MSTLVLFEARIPRTGGKPDLLVTLEWVKVAEGNKPYHLTWREAGLWSQTGAHWYATRTEAMRAALGCTRRLFKGAWA